MASATTSAPQEQVAMPSLDLRRLLGTGISGEGAASVADLLVSQRAAGANMSVDVAAGSAYIKDDHVSGGGYYHAVWSAAENAVIAAAHATLPRIDRVVVRVRDAFLGDPDNSIGIVVVPGAPTGGATLANLTGAAAVPSSSLLLANVLIAALDSSISNAEIDATAKPLLSPVGAYRAYTPTWTASGAAPTIGNGTLIGRYVQIGKLVHFHMSWVAGSTTTFGTGNYSFSLPVAAHADVSSRPIGNVYATHLFTTFASPLAICETTTKFSMQYPATWPTGAQAVIAQTLPWAWANTDAIWVSGTYEAA